MDHVSGIKLVKEAKSIRLPGTVSDKEKMKKTLEWVKDMLQKEGCVEILATHDPEISLTFYSVIGAERWNSVNKG